MKKIIKSSILLLTVGGLIFVSSVPANAALISDRRSCSGSTKVALDSQSGASGYHAYETATQYGKTNFAYSGLWQSQSQFSSARWSAYGTTYVQSATPSCR